MKRVEKRQVDNCLQSRWSTRCALWSSCKSSRWKRGPSDEPRFPHMRSHFLGNTVERNKRGKVTSHQIIGLDKALHIVSKEEMITLGFSNCFRALPGGSPCEKTNWRIGGRRGGQLMNIQRRKTSDMAWFVIIDNVRSFVRWVVFSTKLMIQSKNHFQSEWLSKKIKYNVNRYTFPKGKHWISAGYFA